MSILGARLRFLGAGRLAGAAAATTAAAAAAARASVGGAAAEEAAALPDDIAGKGKRNLQRHFAKCCRAANRIHEMRSANQAVACEQVFRPTCGIFPTASVISMLSLAMAPSEQTQRKYADASQTRSRVATTTHT